MYIAVTGKKRTRKKHIGNNAPEKSAYVYKRMGKKRTRKEAHTEKAH